ncbi:hypothetical protein D3C85_1118780 [compost metagenome]
MADLFRQHRIEERRIECCGQVDTFLSLSLAATKIGNDQPWLFHQRVRFTELRGTTIRQSVVGTTIASLTRHTVGVCKGEKCTEPTRIVGIRHRFQCRAPEVAAELPSELTSSLHGTSVCP